MTVRYKSFTDFNKGEWGRIGGYQAVDGMFSSTNMLVYQDGSIGPRPGLRAMTVTGLANGVVQGFGSIPVSSGIWFIQGTAFRHFPFGGGAVTTASSPLAGTPTNIVTPANGGVYLGDALWFTSKGDAIYKFAPGANSLSSIATTQNGFDLALYRDRLYSCAESKVWYSDAADFNTWGVGSYFDVGYQYNNYRLAEIRNALHIFRQAQGSVWMLTGTPEATSVLRQVSSGLGPSQHPIALSRSEQSVWWIPGVRRAPVVWNGAVQDDKALAHLEDWTTTSDTDTIGASYSYEDGDVLFVAPDTNGLMRRWGVWTKHDLGVAVTQLVSRHSDQYFVFCNGGGAGSNPVFWSWQHGLDRPAFTGDSRSQPGDGSDTPLTASLFLPEQWAPSGLRRRLRQVVVDFTSWNTGTSATAHFDLVTSVFRLPSRVAAETATQSFDEAVASSSTSGTERSVTFNFGGEGWGLAYQLAFSAVRSVSIRGVHVSYDEDERDNRF